MFSNVQDLNLVAWRGRWSNLKTLEYYLQEVSAFMMVHQLDAISRSKIFFLSDCSMMVLRSSFCLDLAEQDNRSGKQNLCGQKSQTVGCANGEFYTSFRDTDHGQIGSIGQHGLRPKRSEVLRPQLKPS